MVTQLQLINVIDHFKIWFIKIQTYNIKLHQNTIWPQRTIQSNYC